jgi:endonuclease/exonuclease/phosphatase (EEP) superfamily protein YafD
LDGYLNIKEKKITRLTEQHSDEKGKRSMRRRFSPDSAARLMLSLSLLLTALFTLVVYSPLACPSIEWFAGNQLFRLCLFVTALFLVLHYLSVKSWGWLTLASLLFIVLITEIVRFVPLLGNEHNGKSSDRLKILSFNTRFFFPEYFLNTLKWNEIDIACFQEVMPGDIPAALLSSSGWKNSYFGWYGATDPDGEDGILVVSRKPLELVEKITCPSFRDPERYLYIFKTRLKGMDINVIAVHLEPINLQGGFKSTRGSWKARLEQARLVSKVAGRLEDPVLVIGDFNSTPTDRVVRVLLRGFNDAGRIAGRLLAPTWHQDAPLFRIDYILYRGLKTAADTRIFRLGRSDHLVYCVDLYK